MRLLIDRVLHEERGSMIVTVLVFIPVAIAIAALVIDVGNGMVHRRHLQTQADAGALAGATEFTRCSTSDVSGANTAINGEANDYALTNNPQVGGGDAPSRVAMATNSEPCKDGFLDVRLTDNNVPPFFALTGTHSYHAHARVQAFTQERVNGLLPIALPDIEGQKATAVFVDEDTGQPLKDPSTGSPIKQALTADGAQGGLSILDNHASPVNVPITAENVGVRIVLSWKDSTDCTDPLVRCYDAGSGNGIVHIRGWSASGTVNQSPPNGPQDKPLARSVWLSGGTCSDPYFSKSSGTCTVGVQAKVDFGGDPTKVGATLTASGGGSSSPMTYDQNTGTWTATQGLSVAAGAGPVPVTLDWEETTGKIGSDKCSDKNGNKCKGSFGSLQRSFAASPSRSGPIELAQVLENSVASTNSFQRCTPSFTQCTHNLVVKIGVRSFVQDSGTAPTRLRVDDSNQTQSLDCDPAILNLKAELVSGCAPSYKVNDGTTCPDSPSVLWASGQPWSCVAVETGHKQNQITSGLNQRILGDANATSCPASGKNNWPAIEPGDPRIVKVMLVAYDFTGTGQTTIPITRFASFYITGWQGNGNGGANPCQGNGDDPANPGEVVGHWISYVQPNDGGAGDEPCDFQAHSPCAAVLVE